MPVSPQQQQEWANALAQQKRKTRQQKDAGFLQHQITQEKARLLDAIERGELNRVSLATSALVFLRAQQTAKIFAEEKSRYGRIAPTGAQEHIRAYYEDIDALTKSIAILVDHTDATRS